jgi:hypothetical protein
MSTRVDNNNLKDFERFVRSEVQEMQDSWTDKQRIYIEWLAQPRFSRLPPTQEMIAGQLDVDPSTLTRWSKLDGFQDEVTKLARAGLVKSLPTIYAALIKEAEGGSYQHIQLTLEMSGEYVKKQHNINQGELKAEHTFRFVEEEAATDDDA